MVKISACVIVKNEEKNLPRWFQCVKQIADECIVVDTGSTDRTKEIAVQYGAKVYDFVWCNDFSAAKNYALGKAKGDWIIFLDADEYFNSQDIPLLMKKIKKYNKQKNIDVLMCRLINIDVDNQNKLLEATYQARVFRNRTYIKYAGKVHEFLKNNRNEKKIMQYMDDVVIYHTGYSASLIKEKEKRNLSILLDKINNDEFESSDYMYLASCYSNLHEYEKTIYYIKKFHENKTVMYGVEGKSYLLLILAMQKMGVEWIELEKVFEEARELYPSLRWLKLLEGILLYDYGDYLQSEYILEKILNGNNKEDEITCNLNIDFNYTLLPTAYLYMGRMMKKQKKYDKAIEYYWQGLQNNRYDSNILNDIISLLKFEDPIEIIKTLNNIYATEDIEFLAEVLPEDINRNVKLYYLGKIKNTTLDEVDKLMLIDNNELASELVEKKIKEQYLLLIWTLKEMNCTEKIQRDICELMPQYLRTVWRSLLTDEEISLTSEQQVLKKEIEAFTLGE